FGEYEFYHLSSLFNFAVYSFRICLKKKIEGFESQDKVFPEEYEFIHQAIFTDPDDQSGWFYHLWLLDQTVKTESPLFVSSWPAHDSDLTVYGTRCVGSSKFLFTNCHFDSGALPLILYFNQAVGGVNSCTVNVEFGNETIEDLVWRPLAVNKSPISYVWVTYLKFCTSNGCQVKVSVGHSQGIFSSRALHFCHPSQIAFTMHIHPVETDSAERSGEEFISWSDENFRMYEKQSQESHSVASFDKLNIKNVHEPTNSDWRITTILKEIECFRELLSLTESKIGKLTLARLLIAHDEMLCSDAEGLIHSEEVLGLYNDLMKLDPSHYQYYKDEHSLALLRQVTSSRESLVKHCFHYCDLNNSTCLRLNYLSLSRIGSFEKLLWVQILDLSHNDLRSLE
ncbi:geranylgeranyl transferase type-2 subunit alpha 1, partial [Carica papaya]|uniref:geranylgeranyl transferase type-2 subunit alpha 1 n=1 Tax=Carica papaya TaxID=3649 RepID=UPI000B8D0B7C